MEYAIRCALLDIPARVMIGCQVPSEAIHYELSTLEYTDFKDRIAFENSKFTDETKQLEDLVNKWSIALHYTDRASRVTKC
jgi:hypothetical protein